jgi:hypothetical protein
MTFPVFASGDVLNAADMNGVGLWLVKSQAVGTGVSSVTVTGAFSADYDNYRITYTGGVGSGSASIQMRLGSTATGYYSQLVYAAYASPIPPVSNVPDNNNAQWSYVGANSTTMPRIEMELNNPFQSVRTQMKGSYVDTTLSGNFAGFLDNTTSYTGFTIFGGLSTTLTGGVIRVYGYRN